MESTCFFLDKQTNKYDDDDIALLKNQGVNKCLQLKLLGLITDEEKKMKNLYEQERQWTNNPK